MYVNKLNNLNVVFICVFIIHLSGCCTVAGSGDDWFVQLPSQCQTGTVRTAHSGIDD